MSWHLTDWDGVYICLWQSDSGTLTVVDNFQWHGAAGDFTAGLSLPLQRLSIVNHWTSVTTCSKGKFCPGTLTTLSGLMISPSQRLRERRPMRDRRDRWDQPSVTEEEIMTVITGELCQTGPTGFGNIRQLKAHQRICSGKSDLHIGDAGDSIWVCWC